MIERLKEGLADSIGELICIGFMLIVIIGVLL